MLPKPKEKALAISLRKQGFSYSEILSRVPISQATLSLWLRNIELTQTQVDNLLLKKKNGQSKGAKARKGIRIKQEKSIIKKAKKDIGSISKRELFLLGIMAYWCEGSKQKTHNVSQSVIFSNSDPFLIKLFIRWLKDECFIHESEIIYTLNIHESGNKKMAIEFWSKILQIPTSRFGKTILKKHKVATNRKNVGENYYGLMRITVRKSTNFNRKIFGWVSGINLGLKHI